MLFRGEKGRPRPAGGGRGLEKRSRQGEGEGRTGRKESGESMEMLFRVSLCCPGLFSWCRSTVWIDRD